MVIPLDLTAASNAAAGLIAILLLIGSLITKELIGFVVSGRARRLDRSLGVVVAPLVVAVAAVVVSRVL